MLGLVIAFHLCILFQLIPFNVVWGGKLETVEQMRSYEIMSVVVNLFIAFFIAVKGSCIPVKMNAKVLNFIIWIFVLVFFLNTIGNLLAKTSAETYFFTPLTFVSAILCIRIAWEGKSGNAVK